MFNLKRRTALQRTADSIYAEIVAQSRRPEFYTGARVPDTLDGRFDLLVINAFLFFHRLKSGGADAQDLGQRVFDAMFSDMDQNLREMGVGDMSIGKKVRKMGSAFFGRTKVYDDGLAQYGENPGLLEDAVRRNVFADAGQPDGARDIARYMAQSAAFLKDQDIEQFMKGEISFPPFTMETVNAGDD